jgi:hypothetical protein
MAWRASTRLRSLNDEHDGTMVKAVTLRRHFVPRWCNHALADETIRWARSPLAAFIRPIRRLSAEVCVECFSRLIRTNSSVLVRPGCRHGCCQPSADNENRRRITPISILEHGPRGWIRTSGTRFDRIVSCMPVRSRPHRIENGQLGSISIRSRPQTFARVAVSVAVR